MQLQTNLVKRQSRFYFRSRVPTDLKSHYGKTEILMSLKTSDKRVADYELAKFKVKLYAEFAQIRGDVFDFELKPIIENQPEINTTPTVSNIANSSIVPINAGPTIEKLIEYWSSQSEKRPTG